MAAWGLSGKESGMIGLSLDCLGLLGSAGLQGVAEEVDNELHKSFLGTSRSPKLIADLSEPSLEISKAQK